MHHDDCQTSEEPSSRELDHGPIRTNRAVEPRPRAHHTWGVQGVGRWLNVRRMDMRP